MAYETKALALSIATIVLTILAIIIFIYQRGSTAFYITALVAIIIGFANAWLVRKVAKPVTTEMKEAKPARIQKRRK
ncbi:MAG: hypothetical protein ACP5SA_02185 [Candidatus Micrarchaeia archaeon]